MLTLWMDQNIGTTLLNLAMLDAEHTELDINEHKPLKADALAVKSISGKPNFRSGDNLV